MSLFDIEIRVKAPRIRGLAEFDARPALARMESYLIREVDRNFQTEGAHRGEPWKPLNPHYAEWKRARGRSPKILHLRGTLRAGWGAKERGPTHLIFGALPGVGPDGVDTRDKARWHQHGAGNLPPRVILTPIARDFKELRAVLREEIEWQRSVTE